MNRYQNNFKGAPWYESSLDYLITILGVGGIGSNTALNLARTVQSTIVLVDFDRVEDHNIGSQFFQTSDLGQLKTNALAAALSRYGVPRTKIIALPNNINDFNSPDAYCTPITISAFDNMEARKTAFEGWQTLEDRLLFVDGRLRATEYEIFCTTPEDEEEYKKTLFNSDEVLDDPCTFKQTTYAGMMIGAKITSFIVNFIYNRHIGEDVCVVPFHYKELLELCYTEVRELKLREDV